jgi:sigma-B regulation protein RsbU (phosphoserine phosphatase)
MSRSLEDLTGGRDSAAAIRQLLRSEIEVLRTEIHFLRKDGSRVWLSVSLSVAQDASGQPDFLIAVIHDIDAHKQSQEAHRQTSRQFRVLVDGLKQREERLQKAYDVQKGIAELLQRSLLLTPPPDSFPGVTIKPFYESAYDDALVGGDFFDVFAVDVNLVALVVGDVTGKGLEAATYTAEIKYALRAFLREYADPGIALERLNNFVCDRERLDTAHLGMTYVALAVVLVNTETGETFGASGGIDPPFIIPAGDGEAFQLRLTGALLGVVEDSRYATASVTLAPGDVLGMSTDGLTESRHGKGLFGIDGVMRELQAARRETLAEMEHRVVAAARLHAGGRINDDLCLLLIRRL